VGVSDVICALQRNPGVAAGLVVFALLSNVALLLVDDAVRTILSLFLLAPILLAALAFGWLGGLLLAVLCSALLSPLVFPGLLEGSAMLPLDWVDWGIKSIWFVVIALLVGLLAGNARDMVGQINRLRGTDPLTGMPDLTGARKHLELLLSSNAGGAGEDIHVTQIQVTNYNQLKTLIGVRRTEEIMGQLCQRIMAVMPPDAHVNRSEPDLFTVVFAGSGTVPVKQQFKRLQEVSDAPYEVDGMQVFTDLVAGSASSPRGGASAERLLAGAREQMTVRGRRRGGGLDGGMTFIDGGPANLDLLGEVGRAIEKGEIRVVYQPVLDLRTRAFVQLEALARWNHPTRGLVPPSKFIPLLEQSDVVHEFTRWMIQEAINRVAEWRALGQSLTVSVNLTPRNLMDRTLLQEIPPMLEKGGVSRDALGLEISEQVIMSLKGAQLERMRELKSLGVRCAVDSFVGNRVPLTHLRTLPVDTIKLDVARLCDDNGRLKDAETSRIIVQMAHDLGLEVMASGVENPVQMKEFIALGCDLIQGFLVARPLEADKVAAVLGNAEGHRLELTDTVTPGTALSHAPPAAG